MPYRVLFESTLAEGPTREVVRVLESLPLQVVAVDGPTGGDCRRCPTMPIITLGECPLRLASLSEVGPRGWIAILPAGLGSTCLFLKAGAFAVLRLPVERSMLLSAVSRCLCAAGAPAPEPRGRVGAPAVHAQNHAAAG